MKFETLSLSDAVNEVNAKEIARVLGEIKGVAKVDAALGANSVNVEFNEDTTSVQELRMVLQKAGFAKKAAHVEGLCCGSCGS